MNRKSKKIIKLMQGMSPDEKKKTIQATNIEGVTFDVAMDSLFDGTVMSDLGCINTYTSYSAQTSEIYKKYNGEADYGNSQVRAVIDARVAFISGEGLSVALEEDVSEGHKKLFKDFITLNSLSGNGLFDMVRQTELQGYTVPFLIKGNDNTKSIPIMGLKNSDRGKKLIKPNYIVEGSRNFIDGLVLKSSKDMQVEGEELKLANFVYIRTGGDGTSGYSLTTKTGIVLKECENYDRAASDIRELNYKTARITGNWKTSSDAETQALATALKTKGWKIGDAQIGTADFDYKTPGTGAHSNLKDEMSTAIKTISGVTSVPVHWFGWVDLMSNRATADELYASVYNGTITERTAIQEGLTQLFIKMQELAILSGLITEVTTDFVIKLPMIDLGRFKEMIESYSLLHSEEVISMNTYRNIVPGIDPMQEKKQLKKEREELLKTEPLAKTDNRGIIEEDDETMEE